MIASPTRRRDQGPCNGGVDHGVLPGMRRRQVRVVIGAALFWAAFTGTAVADPAGPTPYESTIVGIEPDAAGIDVRICEAATEEWTLSSSFDESQDSLLAGSVAELQSTHVTSEGRGDGVDATSARGDERSGKGDCWVEFRSNVTRPAGFVKSLFKKSPGITVAKPPDLPHD